MSKWLILLPKIVFRYCFFLIWKYCPAPPPSVCPHPSPPPRLFTSPKPPMAPPGAGLPGQSLRRAYLRECAVQQVRAQRLFLYTVIIWIRGSRRFCFPQSRCTKSKKNARESFVGNDFDSPIFLQIISTASLFHPRRPKSEDCSPIFNGFVDQLLTAPGAVLV